MKPCPKCGMLTSSDANICPNCERPFPPGDERFIWIIVLITVLISVGTGLAIWLHPMP